MYDAVVEKSVYDSKDVDDAILEVCDVIADVLSNDINNVILEKEKILTVSLLQLLSTVKHFTRLHRQIHEIIISSAISSEKRSPGSFGDCVSKIVKNVRAKCIPSFHQTILCEGVIPSRQDIEKIINENVACHYTKDCVFAAINLSGFLGKINVEKTKSNKFSVEQTAGYTFNIPPHFPVNVKFLNPKVLCIDGFIESVSEINRILQDLSEIQSPCLLFARGMSPDVVQTLRVNFDRGSLKVVPLIVRYDLEGVNLLNDIAIVSGGDVVSSLKGQLISTIDINQIQTVESANVTNDRVIILNFVTHSSVRNHVNNLAKKREEVHESTTDFIDKRIRSLSSGHVTIRIPDDMNYVSRSQSVDYVLRKIKHAVDYGVSTGGRLATHEKVIDYFSTNCLKTLSRLGSAVDASI